MSDRSGNQTHQPSVHVINLKGPWVVQQLDDSQPSDTLHRVQIESDWASHFENACIKLTRSFNRPTGLVPNSQQLFVVLETKNIDGVVDLNDNILARVNADNPRLRVSCLAELQNSNRLNVLLNNVAKQSQLTAWLEIVG